MLLQTLPPIVKHSQSTGDVRATQREERKFGGQCLWPKPAAPTPLLLHLGLTARTHDVEEFQQNFPDQFDRFFVDRFVGFFSRLYFCTQYDRLLTR